MSVEKNEVIPSYDVEHITRIDTATGDAGSLAALGYTQSFRRNRSMKTLLFRSLAIAAIPFGIGGPLIVAIYGGGQLALFVG